MADVPSDISEIKATIKGGILTIRRVRARANRDDSYSVDTSLINDSVTRQTPITAKSYYYNNRLLLVKELRKSDRRTIVVYTEQGEVKFYIHDSLTSHPLSRLITVKSKVGYLRLTKRGLRMIYVIAISNPYRLPIKASYLSIGDSVRIKKSYPVYRTMPSKLRILRNIFTDYIALPPLIEGEVPINTGIGVALDLGSDRLATHSLTRGNRRYVDRTKWYYAPLKQTRLNDFSISIRRNAHAGLSLVRRPLEAVEKNVFFRFIESRIMSFLMYHIAHIVRHLSPQVVNIYFEKNANQAEEGTIDLFRRARKYSDTRNFFIINSWSNAYAGIKDEPGVIANFTWRSYWLMYRANNVIATEVPQHINVLRSGNKYVRLASYTQIFVFLQHGIIYLKSLSKTTSFSKGREGEPDYMVVSSRKESDIVTDLFDIEEERLLNTGLASFDDIGFGRITAKSEDIVTIMLTWRPSEEHLKDFADSRYYRINSELYEMLAKRVPKDHIRIIAHPKFAKLMNKTDMAAAMWQKPISDALKETKLLITDYSSVCYNVFYQGGGVVFYQPDLAEYEYINGTLIPTADEYIGKRCLTSDEIRLCLDDVISGGKVALSKLRNKRFSDNYALINEHHDGRNKIRLYEKLHKLGIL